MSAYSIPGAAMYTTSIKPHPLHSCCYRPFAWLQKQKLGDVRQPAPRSQRRAKA